MRGKSEIVFTFPSKVGGVASFNYNIINYGNLRSFFYVKVVLLKEETDLAAEFLDVFNADEIIKFNYSDFESQYSLQKRLNCILGETEGAIVTDNGLTIYSASRFRNPKTIYHLVHDFYYVNVNTKLIQLIDVSIAHSSFFTDIIYAANPQIVYGRNFYIPYGVTQNEKLPEKADINSKLNLVFLGRLDESKGVLFLKTIDSLLVDQGVYVNWTIIGKGPLRDQLSRDWSSNANISFFEPDSVMGVYEILQKQDLFIFPTSFEGTPVSILECLSNAVVPITNDLPGGIREVLVDGIGFRCGLNDLSEFVDKIVSLNGNRELLLDIQKKCFEYARLNYDIKHNAINYTKIFLQWNDFKREKQVKAPRLVKMDSSYFPNWFVKRVRIIRNRFR